MTTMDGVPGSMAEFQAAGLARRQTEEWLASFEAAPLLRDAARSLGSCARFEDDDFPSRRRP